MSRWAKRQDGTHHAVIDWLRARGWHVEDVSRYPEYFALIAGKHGRVVFTEAKNWHKPPSARQLTPAQVKLHARYRAMGAEVVVVETEADLAQFERPRTGLGYDERQMGVDRR